MKNIFKRIATWYRENKQYEGFWQMELFGLISIMVLISNICRLSTEPADYMLLLLELFITWHFVVQWLSEKKFKDFSDFVAKIMDEDHRFIEAVMARCEAEHKWLLASNRRRKRAEKKLKKKQKMYRYALERHIELLHKVYDAKNQQQ